MKKIFTVMAVLLSVSTSAKAENWSISGLIGYGVGENSFSGLTYGAQVDYAFNPDWSAGVYWSMTKDVVTVMPIMAQLNYQIADMKGLHIGPRLGIVSTSLAGVSSSDFAIGAQAGYDFSIATDWSLGIDANWNLIMATVSSSLFNFVVPVTYHF